MCLERLRLERYAACPEMGIKNADDSEGTYIFWHGSSLVTRKDVILNAGEADAKDRTSDNTIDAVSRVAPAACCVVCPTTSPALSAVVRSLTQLGGGFRMKGVIE